MARAFQSDIMAELFAITDHLQHLLGRQEILRADLLYGDRGARVSSFIGGGTASPGDVQTLVNHIFTVLVRLTRTYRLNSILVGSRGNLTPVTRSHLNRRTPVQETLEGSRGTMSQAVC